MSIQTKTFFDAPTATFTHVVTDPQTASTAVIDSVLNYDQYTGRSTTTSADEVIAYLHDNHLKLEWILETHIHADHLTASRYLKEKLGGKTAIGSHILDVLAFWVPIFNTSSDTPLDGSQFDLLFDHQQSFKLGTIDVKVLHTPGHTPACACYLMEDAIFVGDTLFMPDTGTARTDFPGGSAETMYDSIHRILSLPDHTRIFLCHDYPPSGRAPQAETTVRDEKEKNIFINEKINKKDYVTKRNQRDASLAAPNLLLPSIQFNMRGGSFGQTEKNGKQYIKIPINTI